MSSIVELSEVGTRARRQVALRLLPFVFLLYVVAFLDRANVAYAKLTMSPELGFSEAVYGFGAGLFFDPVDPRQAAAHLRSPSA